MTVQKIWRFKIYIYFTPAIDVDDRGRKLTEWMALNGFIWRTLLWNWYEFKIRLRMNLNIIYSDAQQRS